MLTSANKRRLKKAYEILGITLTLVYSIGMAVAAVAYDSLFLGTGFGLPLAIIFEACNLILSCFVFYMALLSPKSEDSEKAEKKNNAKANSFLAVAIPLLLINGVSYYIYTHMSILMLSTTVTWPISASVYLALAITLGLAAAVSNMMFTGNYLYDMWDYLQVVKTTDAKHNHNSMPVIIAPESVNRTDHLHAEQYTPLFQVSSAPQGGAPSLTLIPHVNHQRRYSIG